MAIDGTGEEPPKSVLARGLSLLDAFGSGDGELNLTELSARTGLPKPTAHRLLNELVRWGGVERTEYGYRLSMRLFVLGQRAPRPRGLREAALPYMEDLYEATHENIHLAVMDGTDTLFLEKVSGRRSMPIVSRVGGRLPAYCTATGKLFLSLGPPERLQSVLAAGLVRYTPHTIVMPGLLKRELARTSARGYAVNREESEAGVSAVAAPVFDRQRQPIAALSITGNAYRLDLDRLAPAVRTAALALSRELARESDLKMGIPR
ncbi:IclR family transcriptional regulator [Actinomadura pelletieri DSM 43383]|uniref:IclR family transcriptional regulator n=1 Tax=Actinomadura pelletieri DSM 43383 TaxID=1120940 RepID=A0A495QMM7_9ACTN|nr:IclR family transcriptional regulator [Actinomadura pelletieri]RKS74230.1 IclR family transcriptional regulator [Actinomadura pelletieri DSM 43383]